jgi:hypothetical protein
MLPNSKTKTIFDFNSSSDAKSWNILNDGVMGGVSSSTFEINKDGHGVFEGNVSTANNGGFASVRYRSTVATENSEYIKIRLKGDGKNYQFRIKKNGADFESYITTFSTSGNWETINIKLSDLYPSFRGRELDKPNFGAATFEEISILIANKQNESFKLILDKIEIE